MNIFTPLLHIYEYIQYFLRMRSFIPRQWCVAARSRIMNRRSHCGSSHLHMYVCLVHCWRDSVQYDRRGSISTEATSRKPRVLSLTFLRAFHFIWATKFSLNWDELFITYWAQIRFVWIMRCPQFSFAWQLSLHKWSIYNHISGLISSHVLLLWQYTTKLCWKEFIPLQQKRSHFCQWFRRY